MRPRAGGKQNAPIGGPDIAENGAVVPLTASTALPGVKQMLILVEKNPAILVAVCNFTRGGCCG